MKHSEKPSTAGPNRLPDEIGALRKSASFISVIVSQRWRSKVAGHRMPDGLGGGFGGM